MDPVKNVAAATAAKSLQSCPTLRDPIDGSPPGSPVPGILQAKTLDFMKVKSESEVAQSCPTLSDRMDCNLPGSCVHWIFQSRVLEWVAIAFSIENPPIMQESWVPSLDWEDPWKREQLTTPVFWSEEFHGQRNLAG